MELFAFSKPRTRYEDLEEWKEWFSSRGIYSTILPRDTDGMYVLYREGLEATLPLEEDDYDDPLSAIPRPCLICGGRDHILKPHPWYPRYIFCCDCCENTARTRAATGNLDLVKEVLKPTKEEPQ